MHEARARGFDLPPDVVALEDSLASPAFRGRGVAPSAWAMIADTYGERGKRWMITKVAVENTASRRAVEKAGFREVGIMQIVYRDWRTRIRVLPIAGAEREHLWLTRLDRG
jgi:RimJ/RimL family protein N-acetyltransferase